MNGLERLLRDLDHPEMIGEGITNEVAAVIADCYPPGRAHTNGQHGGATTSYPQDANGEQGARADLATSVVSTSPP